MSYQNQHDDDEEEGYYDEDAPKYAQPEERKTEEISDLEKRITRTRQEKRERALKQTEHNQFDDDDDREFDSQGLQQAQHGDNVFYTLFPSFSFKTYTFALIALQIIGCIVLYIYAEYIIDKKKVLKACPDWYREQEIKESNCLTIKECASYELGGRYTPALTERNQYYRLFTSLLIQSDPIQLFMNIFTSMIYGFVCENYYGGKRFAYLFFFVGIFGNFFGLLFKTKKVYAGASASTYGLYGMNTVYMIEHYNYMGEERQTHIKNFAWIIVAAFMLYMLDDESDSVNLPFSYALGFALTFLYVHTERRDLRILQRLTYLLIFGSIGALCYFITTVSASYREEILPCYMEQQFY